ncbi:hypothetical protein Tco_0397388 [Tanacetum coccineum]
MEHYLAHIDYPIWEVIQKGNGPVSVTTDTNGVIKVLSPRTAKETLARERERKARTTLLMALPEDHLANFHKMTDAKEMWEAIKSRFGGNEESKKMQGIYSLSIDDLYNNLRVFETDIKGSTASSSSTHNVAFISSESTNSTNDVSIAYVDSTTTGNKSQKETPSSCSLLANQSSLDWTSHSEDEQDNYAFMAFSNSGSDTEDSNTDDRTLYDRFVTDDGMYAVPPPLIGNYIPFGSDIEIDKS